MARLGVRRFEDLVAIEIRDRHLRRRDEVEWFVTLQFEKILFELGKLPGTGEGRAIHQIRRRDLEIAVLAGVQVEQQGAGGVRDVRRVNPPIGQPPQEERVDGAEGELALLRASAADGPCSRASQTTSAR